MNNMLIAITSFVILVPPTFASEADEGEAVIDAMQQWESAVEMGNYDRLENLYTKDAIYYPNHGVPIVGRNAIIDSNKQRGAGGVVEITQHVDDVQINGNWAVYSCLANVEVLNEQRVSKGVRTARVLLLMQRGKDGQWRIHRDIDNQPLE